MNAGEYSACLLQTAQCTDTAEYPTVSRAVRNDAIKKALLIDLLRKFDSILIFTNLRGKGKTVRDGILELTDSYCYDRFTNGSTSSNAGDDLLFRRLPLVTDT